MHRPVTAIHELRKAARMILAMGNTTDVVNKQDVDPLALQATKTLLIVRITQSYV